MFASTLDMVISIIIIVFTLGFVLFYKTTVLDRIVELFLVVLNSFKKETK